MIGKPVSRHKVKGGAAGTVLFDMGIRIHFNLNRNTVIVPVAGTVRTPLSRRKSNESDYL
jgi:hypothetical protein